MVCILHGYYDARPTMRPSPSPPASKATIPSTLGEKSSSRANLVGDQRPSKQALSNNNNHRHTNTGNVNNNHSSHGSHGSRGSHGSHGNHANHSNHGYNKETESGRRAGLGSMQREEDGNSNRTAGGSAETESISDYKQWLHAMKLVARLPGGIPPEFRRKLWLSLADKYLKSKNVDWNKEQEKCFCDKSGDDDEELGIQIVKDLHRTGSTLCTGPAADVNQAKLKRILLGYARYNPEVGYCQGFNMLGALILQVMDKDEAESMKVMVYLVEGILPPGYFCGSMCGLQADMAVFRELMQNKLPRLARHLQKLQGPIENAYEPPLTNVFTMQWFLTMFCTCLPMTCVLRVWDLVLIEGSDVLLRTALALWSLLEDRVLGTRSPDDFYGKMGSFSSELLNGHLIDSNGLIEKVVQLGPIQDIQRLRDKHLIGVEAVQRRQRLNFYYEDDEPEMDEASRLAVATVWGIPWVRRGSQGQAVNAIAKQAAEGKDRLALDISLLKKQYDRLRQRQKQAHIILTTACSTARQTGSAPNCTPAPLQVNQLLLGRPAIVTNKGRRGGAPTGAIPPARKPSLPAVLQEKPVAKKLRRGETIQWRDDGKTRRDSLTWKEIRAERAAMSTMDGTSSTKSEKFRAKRLGKSDSSSYSEDSEENENAKDDSSSDTSLCDEDYPLNASARKHTAFRVASTKSRGAIERQKNSHSHMPREAAQRQRPKSWAPSNSDIPFVLMTADSQSNSADESAVVNPKPSCTDFTMARDEYYAEEEAENSATESDQNRLEKADMSWNTYVNPRAVYTDDVSFGPPTKVTLSTSESTILDSPPPPAQLIQPPSKISLKESTKFPCPEGRDCYATKEFDVSDEGVTNEYFERVNSTERPTKLDLSYCLNEETSIRNAYKEPGADSLADGDERESTNARCMDILVDYSEKSSAACIAEAKTEISGSLQAGKPAIIQQSDNKNHVLTRSSTMDIEQRYQALEKRLSMEVSSKYVATGSPTDRKSVLPPGDLARPALCNPMALEDIEMPIPDSSGGLAPRLEEVSTRARVDEQHRKSKIPSTADLEQRFANIVLDHMCKMSSMSDSEQTEKSRKSSTTSNQVPELNSPRSNCRPKNDHSGRGSPSDELQTKSLPQKNATAFDDATQSVELDKGGHKESDNPNEEPPNQKDLVPDENPKKRDKEPPDCEPKEIDKRLEDCARRSPKRPSHTSIEECTLSPPPADQSITKEPNVEVCAANQKRNENPTPPPASPQTRIEPSATSASNVSSQADGPCAPETQPSSTDKSQICQRPSPPPSSITSPKADGHDPEPNAADEVAETEAAPSGSKDNKSSGHKKAVPSTEELEKRFNALEKQMSITKAETEKVGSSKIAGTEQANEAVDGSRRQTQSPGPEGIVNEHTTPSAPTRRASEPPSTDELEKRYEVLKRRMSSRNFEIDRKKTTFASEMRKCVRKNVHDTSSSSSESQNKDPLDKNGKDQRSEEELDIAECERKNMNESSGIESQDKHISDKNGQTRRSLEVASKVASKVIAENVDSNAKAGSTNDKTSSSESETTAQRADSSEGEVRNSNLADSREHKDLSTATVHDHEEGGIERDPKPESRSALIEELNSRLVAAPDDACIKPSSINLSRKKQNSQAGSTRASDVTSETHATRATARSEKHEPVPLSNRKMVRRFSDLPSRADLENRLHFLEEKLSKTLGHKPRRASDSEVASHRSDHETLSESVVHSASVNYCTVDPESRYHSLDGDQRLSSDVQLTSSPIPMQIKADAVGVTGKELVRYTQRKEADVQTPLNISINIHMTLNKDEHSGESSLLPPRSEDINKRLLILEQQLKNTQLNIMATSVASEGPTTSSHYAQATPPADDSQEMSLGLKRDPKGPAETTTTPKTEANVHEPDAHVSSQVTTGHKPELTSSCGEISSENRTDPGVSNHADHKPSPLCRDQDSAAPAASHDTAVHTASTQATTEATITAKHSSPVAQAQAEIQEPKTVPEEQLSKPIALPAAAASTEDLGSVPTSTAPQSDESTKEQTPPATVTGRPKALGNQLSGESVIKTNADNKKISPPPEQAFQQSGQPQAATDASVAPAGSSVTASLDTDASASGESEAQQHEGPAESAGDVVSPPEPASPDKHQRVARQIVPVEVNKKTLVLLLDNEPKTVKVRRLTRANTEELEGLFEALERQLNERGQTRSALPADPPQDQKEILTGCEMHDLTKEIAQLAQSSQEESVKGTMKEPTVQDDFDWGKDPVKHHLKKKTVYLPSTRELEARFRSLERQIKLLEDVEKIDVEQRLAEIERKIKLQYSLSNEKDLVRFLDLCEGKIPNDSPPCIEHGAPNQRESEAQITYGLHQCESSARVPNVPKVSVARHLPESVVYPLPEAATRKESKQVGGKRQPIHPLEMLLDPSPSERDIPSTGELEHRIRMLSENKPKASPASGKANPKSPISKPCEGATQHFESQSPTERGLPTAAELEARLEALEREEKFDFKMQKNYKQFNQKLKDVISPSLSFDEFKAARSSSSDSAHKSSGLSPSSKAPAPSLSNSSDTKSSRFHGEGNPRPSRASNDPKITLTECSYSATPSHCALREGLGVMGTRLMRETSPLRRKGTYTGIPLRTGENINDQLASIQNTIKSIDTLCEEKPYRSERCEQYINSLFADTAFESRHRSRSTSRECAPSVRVSRHSPAFKRSLGSADSIRSSSPLRSVSPQQYHSSRDLRREISPRRRFAEDQEEGESRVRRDNLKPYSHSHSNSLLSQGSNSLTQFYKVDSQLISHDSGARNALRSPTLSRNPATLTFDTISTSEGARDAHDAQATCTDIAHANSSPFKRPLLDMPTSPYRQVGLVRSNTPPYTPAKLEIRHTTVTSTFYDRVLAEKQLGKRHCAGAGVAANKSPTLELSSRAVIPVERSAADFSILDPPDTQSAASLSGTGKYHSFTSATSPARTPSMVMAPHIPPSDAPSLPFI